MFCSEERTYFEKSGTRPPDLLLPTWLQQHKLFWYLELEKRTSIDPMISKHFVKYRRSIDTAPSSITPTSDPYSNKLLQQQEAKQRRALSITFTCAIFSLNPLHPSISTLPSQTPSAKQWNQNLIDHIHTQNKHFIPLHSNSFTKKLYENACRANNEMPIPRNPLTIERKAQFQHFRP